HQQAALARQVRQQVRHQVTKDTRIVQHPLAVTFDSGVQRVADLALHVVRVPAHGVPSSLPSLWFFVMPARLLYWAPAVPRSPIDTAVAVPIGARVGPPYS